MPSRVFTVLLMIFAAPITLAQPSPPLAGLLLQFDNERDYAAKERLLRTVTGQYAGSGPELLRLAQSTANTDTRWLAMRGMAALHFTACAPFLEASLKDSDIFVRANAARALGDLRIRTAAAPLLAMFDAEREPGAIEQASLALRVLEIRAAAPYIREKIPAFTGQTRGWLIQALGTLGSIADVPLIAGYLEEMAGDAATQAIQELTGVSFGPRSVGISSFPPPETIAAQAWWKAHKTEWPRCDDCRPR